MPAVRRSAAQLRVEPCGLSREVVAFGEGALIGQLRRKAVLRSLGHRRARPAVLTLLDRAGRHPGHQVALQQQKPDDDRDAHGQ
jgi:hypothetical protein